MDAPDVPRTRPKARFRAFGSTLTSFVKQQYPSQNGAKSDDPGRTSPPDGEDRSKAVRSRRNTTSPPVDLPMANQPAVEDFQSRHTIQSQRSSSRPRTSPSKSLSSPDFDRPVSPYISDIETPDAAPSHFHIPSRTSSSNARQPGTWRPTPKRIPSSTTQVPSPPGSPGPPTERGYDRGERSSADSLFSQETSATSIHTLPPLQTKGPDNGDAQQLEPVLEDDPRSWDLVAPPADDQEVGMYLLEKQAEQMMGAGHLRTIFEDPKLLLNFSGFLTSHRPSSIPVLIYYLDALKALRAIDYANAISEALDPIRGHEFSTQVPKPTLNAVLQAKADGAFEALIREDLPAYIAHTWIQVVSVSVQRRITGTLAPHLREASEGLGEVFCLTDPSRTDDPIVFASEEFTRTTQYGMSYVIGRNCRFLQGPKTNQHSVRRLAEACAAGKEHTEVFVNYRRDGSPFMNLLMIAPLMDSRGNVRYHIGAQVDVSGLLKDCVSLDGLAKLIEKERDSETVAGEAEVDKRDEFQRLSEMFNGAELETVRKTGGRMHKEYVDDSDTESISAGRRRIVLKDPSQDILDRQTEIAQENTSTPLMSPQERVNGKLQGVYQNYLLVRPAPSLRILFTSPSLRVPGILQSPFLNRIGGSSRVRADLAAALGEGRGVTAKIRWLLRASETGEGEGRPRWIHCTPLLGHSGAVGVWMIILVDGENPQAADGRRFRAAPPVAANIGGKEWDGSAASARAREAKHLNSYDMDQERRGIAVSKDDPGAGAGAAAATTSHAVPASKKSFDARRRPPSTSRSKHTTPSIDETEDFPFSTQQSRGSLASVGHYTYGDGI